MFHLLLNKMCLCNFNVLNVWNHRGLGLARIEEVWKVMMTITQQCVHTWTGPTTLLYYLKHCIDQKWPWYRVDAVFEIVKKKSRPPSHKHLGQARKSRCMRAPINSLATLYNIFAKYELHSFKMVLLRCTHPRNVRARQKI